MENAFAAFLSTQFLLFCLMLAALTFVARKVVEYFMKKGNLSKSNIWTELLLPVLPVLLGGAIAYFATKYPYPEGIESSSARIVWGTVAGLLSSLTYRIVKSRLKLIVNKNKGKDE